MQNDYRINVRFRLDRPEEKEVTEYLSTLGRSRNQFIVGAVIEQIRNQDHALSFSLSDIRKVVKEELQSASVSPSVGATNEGELSGDMSELDPNVILDSLSIFD